MVLEQYLTHSLDEPEGLPPMEYKRLQPSCRCESAQSPQPTSNGAARLAARLTTSCVPGSHSSSYFMALNATTGSSCFMPTDSGAVVAASTGLRSCATIYQPTLHCAGMPHDCCSPVSTCSIDTTLLGRPVTPLSGFE
eukprot:513923-Prymnesium_polylepis.1